MKKNNKPNKPNKTKIRKEALLIFLLVATPAFLMFVITNLIKHFFL